jgi:hypothetical protein
MGMNASIAEKMIAELGMKDLPVREITPVRTQVAPDWFQKYKTLCHEFMRSLSDSIETLAVMGLPQEDFMGILTGRALPENLSFRFRIPLVWGGKLELDNLFLCKTFPHSFNMDIFLLSQSGNQTIWIPDPAKKIYLPVSTLGGGAGGNGTEDRITESIASQLAADRDM